MLWQQVPAPENGRRFVVGDIHGCNKTLQTLVREQLQLTKEDQLFLLGDYVNRGPDSLGVLQYVMGLQETGYQIFPLRGNHEQMLLDKLTMRDRLSEETVLMGRESLARNITPEQRAWLRKLPYYYALDKFYLVHGAFNVYAKDPLQDYNFMIWERATDADDTEEWLVGKHIVHGHTVYDLEDIQEAINSRAYCIPLDNGCYKGIIGKEIHAGLGSLCALELDAWKLYVQENKD